MNITNLTFNVTQITPLNEVVTMTDIDFIRSYCSQLDRNIFIFILIYWVYALGLQLAYRMKWITHKQYISITQSFMATYVAFGLITLAYMIVRIL